jgi:hypothetical protein
MSLLTITVCGLGPRTDEARNPFYSSAKELGELERDGTA